MTKSELRNGMLVQVKSGRWYMVIKDTMTARGYRDIMVNTEDTCYLELSEYNSDMTMKFSEFNVVQVCQCNYTGDAVKGIKNGSKVERYKDFKVLWTRENPEVSKVKSVIAELQGQLSAAQAKLEALR